MQQAMKIIASGAGVSRPRYPLKVPEPTFPVRCMLSLSATPDMVKKLVEPAALNLQGKQITHRIGQRCLCCDPYYCQGQHRVQERCILRSEQKDYFFAFSPQVCSKRCSLPVPAVPPASTPDGTPGECGRTNLSSALCLLGMLAICHTVYDEHSTYRKILCETVRVYHRYHSSFAWFPCRT